MERRIPMEVDVSRWVESRKDKRPERRSGFWVFRARAPEKECTVETDGLFTRARERALSIFSESMSGHEYTVELLPFGREFTGSQD
jgi:hypothetical protein